MAMFGDDEALDRHGRAVHPIGRIGPFSAKLLMR
jgi:hypothetical protein